MPSYTVDLWCGCRVYVSCHPRSGLAHTRIVEQRGPSCPDRQHAVGTRLWLWEILPDGRSQQPTVDLELT